MNRKDIVLFLENIGPAEFQELGDRLLPIYKNKYENLISKGNHIYENKTIKGTPDSYKYIKNKIIAVQYTVSKSDIEKKLLDDLNKIIKWQLFGNVNEILLICNSRQNDNAEKTCRDILKKIGNDTKIEILWIDNIVKIIEDNYDAKIIIKNYLNIDLTEISLTRDFKKYYRKTYYENKKNMLNKSRDKILDQYQLHVNVFDKNKNKKKYNSLIWSNKGLLCGKSGSGKSFILTNVFLYSFYKSKDYSIYIDLKGYNGQSIVSLLKKNLECNEIRISNSLIEQFLCEGKFFILFDGFDEIDAENRKKLINNFFQDDRFEKNRFLISTRYAIDEINLIEINERYYIKSMSKRTVNKKVLKTLISKEELAKLNKYLMDHKLSYFLHNPLNLSFLINILKKCEYSNIDDVISQLKDEVLLYENYIQLLIKRELHKLTYINISYEHMQQLMSYISYYMMDNYILKIDENDFNKIISNWLKGREFDYKIIDIKTILINTIFNSYEGKVDFIHKNLKVYLCYKYINKELDWKSITCNPIFNDVIIWASVIDNNFLSKYIQQISCENLIEIFSEIENEKVDNFLKYIKIFFSLKTEDEMKSKLNIVFQRFRYDNKVLEIVFEYLNSISRDKEYVDEILENDINIKYILNREECNYVFGNVLPTYFLGVERGYDIINRKWIEQGENNKLIKIISFYMLRSIMNENRDYKEIFKIYANALVSNDEELVYNALLSVRIYIYIDYTFDLFNCRGMSAKGKDLISLFTKLNRNISERVKLLAEKIDHQMHKEPMLGIKELGVRIRSYRQNEDYKLGIDFAKSTECSLYRDELIEVLGKKCIGEILTFSLKEDMFDIESILKILDCIYFYCLTDKNVMSEVLKLMHWYYANRFEEKEVKTECLKVLCGRISKSKLETLYTFYNYEKDDINKLLLIWGMWITIEAYHEKISVECNEYLVLFREKMEEYRFYVSLNLKDFLILSIKLWNASVYIKDYDNELMRWSYKYKEFFYYIIDNIDISEIFELCFEIKSKYDECEEIIVDLISSLKDKKWLKLLREKDSECWDRRVSEILNNWNIT